MSGRTVSVIFLFWRPTLPLFLVTLPPADISTTLRSMIIVPARVSVLEN